MTTENSSQETSAATTATTSSDATPQAAPAADTTSAASSAAPATEGIPAAAAAPAYQPNYKFKAFGKEHEIEEWMRPLAKDAATEEKLRKFHEKAYAMEQFKTDREKLKGEFEGYKSKTDPDLRAMNHFNKLLVEKDWDNFFGGLKIPREEIFEWTRKQLELEQMGPQAKADYDRANQIRQQNYLYEQQMQSQQTQYQSLAVETRQMQLENIMSRQDIQSQAEKVDGAYGRPGAFRDLVIEEAANHYHRTGQDLPADAAVQLAINKFGVFLRQPTMAGAAPTSMANPSVAPAPAAAASGQPAPIIPHVAGSGRSPVKKVMKSLDDLKAKAQELRAQGN